MDELYWLGIAVLFLFIIVLNWMILSVLRKEAIIQGQIMTKVDDLREDVASWMAELETRVTITEVRLDERGINKVPKWINPDSFITPSVQPGAIKKRKPGRPPRKVEEKSP